MIERLQKISLYQALKFDTITRIPNVDTLVSNAFLIKFGNTLNPILSGGNFSSIRTVQMSILRNMLKREFFPLLLEIYFIDDCAMIWIERTLKEEKN